MEVHQREKGFTSGDFAYVGSIVAGFADVVETLQKIVGVETKEFFELFIVHKFEEAGFLASLVLIEEVDATNEVFKGLTGVNGTLLGI